MFGLFGNREPVVIKERPSGAVSNGFNTHHYQNYTKRQIVKEAGSHHLISVCASKIAIECAQIKFKTENDDIAAILEKPNPEMTGNTLIQLLCQSLALTGDAFLTPFEGSLRKRELWFERPERMSYRTDNRGKITKWVFEHDYRTVEFEPEEVIHMRHPWISEDIFGVGAGQKASKLAQFWDGYCDWNNGLLRGAQGVSEIFALDEGEGLGDGAVEELSKLLSQFKTGGDKQGGSLFVNAKIRKVSDGVSPEKLQALNWFGVLTDSICNAFGVPPILVNVGDGATFENQKEARASFIEDTVLPGYAFPIARALTNYYGVEIEPDIDNIPALVERRLKRMERVNGLNTLTINERREMNGFPPVQGGDALYQPATEIPLGFDMAATPEAEVESTVRSSLPNLRAV